MVKDVKRQLIQERKKNEKLQVCTSRSKRERQTDRQGRKERKIETRSNRFVFAIVSIRTIVVKKMQPLSLCFQISSFFGF